MQLTPIISDDAELPSPSRMADQNKIRYYINMLSKGTYKTWATHPDIEGKLASMDGDSGPTHDRELRALAHQALALYREGERIAYINNQPSREG